MHTQVARRLKFALILVAAVAAAEAVGYASGFSVVTVALLGGGVGAFVLLRFRHRCRACGSWLTLKWKDEPSYDGHIECYRINSGRSCLRCKHVSTSESSIVGKEEYWRRQNPFHGF